MPRKNTARTVGTEPEANGETTNGQATKARTTKGQAAKPQPLKMTFFLGDLALVKIGEGGLALLPGVMDTVSRDAVRDEYRLGGGAGGDGEFLVEPLRKAMKEGRLLTGWSRTRAKEKTLTWAEWDMFVLRWCGVHDYRSPDRKDVLDSEVLLAEAQKLEELNLVELVGRLPTLGRPPEKPKPKPKKARGRRDDDAE